MPALTISKRLGRADVMLAVMKIEEVVKEVMRTVLWEAVAEKFHVGCDLRVAVESERVEFDGLVARDF